MLLNARHTTAKITLIILVALALLICSCKKSSPQGPSETPEETPAVSAQPGTTAEPQTAETTAPETPEATTPDEPSAQQTGDLEPIPLKLPKPMFVGTPQSFQGITNLEKPLGKPRSPFYAPKGTTNVAAEKPVASSDDMPIIGEIEMIIDGDKEAADGSYVELGPFLQHVTIDLGAAHNIYAIVVWHYHKQARVYRDVVVQVADDPDFITNVRTIFNNDIDNSAGLGTGSDMHYVETSEGKLIDAKGVVARYIRCYSNGNSSNDMNNYIEVEVYGIPVQ